MRKVLITILVLTTILCSGGFAQSGPNSFSIALDPNLKDVRTLSCGEEGFCIYTEKKTRKIHQITLTHCDTLLQKQWDTTLVLPDDWKQHQIFYENDALVILFRFYQRSNFTDKGIFMLYHPKNKTFETQEVSGLPTIAGLELWHHFEGNTLFASMEKNGDNVWFLPKGSSTPLPFSFTRENPGYVLDVKVDTAQRNAVICCTSGGRTMYFETDFLGKSSFANIINERASNAQWIPVGKDHSVLMLYYENDETFYMHPINILNHKVIPNEEIYCADILVPKSLPATAKTKRTIIVTPHSNVSFLPTYAQCANGRIYCTTELYYAEYYNYYNGWYVEPRFNGYRYERADVHFFDTNGVFLTNTTFPYNEEYSLHSTILKKLRVNALPDSTTLLYTLSKYDITTMLLDEKLKIKDPVRTSDITLMGATYSLRTTRVDAIEPWYGQNRFLLTAYKIRPGSTQRIGLIVNKVEYQ